MRVRQDGTPREAATWRCGNKSLRSSKSALDLTCATRIESSGLPSVEDGQKWTGVLIIVKPETVVDWHRRSVPLSITATLTVGTWASAERCLTAGRWLRSRRRQPRSSPFRGSVVHITATSGVTRLEHPAPDDGLASKAGVGLLWHSVAI